MKNKTLTSKVFGKVLMRQCDHFSTACLTFTDDYLSGPFFFLFLVKEGGKNVAAQI